MQDITAPERTKGVLVLRNEAAMLTEKGKKHGQQRKVAVMGRSKSSKMAYTSKNYISVFSTAALG